MRHVSSTVELWSQSAESKLKMSVLTVLREAYGIGMAFPTTTPQALLLVLVLQEA